MNNSPSSLQIYDTRTRKKLLFVPDNPERVSIYVCGVTVYDYCHVGHGRVLVAFDMIVRYLRYLGYSVVYVRNITDIDDKIIRRANENKESIVHLTRRFAQAMQEDLAALGVASPDIEPWATDHMEAMVVLIQRLLDKGYAYQGDNGDVYYDVRRFTDYGALVQQDLAALRSGIRVEVRGDKRDPLDFVLWKHSNESPSWPSPWGKGRPGWHLECSAMSLQHLGASIDIHGGGLDLQFPHHQNEIAQSEAATGCVPFVRHWMHAGHVQVNQEKMSKSLGNFFTLRAAFSRYAPEVVRYFLLQSHYRSPIQYAEEHLDNATVALRRWYTVLRDVQRKTAASSVSLKDPAAEIVSEGELRSYQTRFVDAMNDDFNTPQAFAVLFDMVREIHRCLSEAHAAQARALAKKLQELAGILGLLQLDPEDFLHAGVCDEDVTAIETLIAARAKARADCDWERADAVRAELESLAVLLEDTPEGTVWRKKTR